MDDELELIYFVIRYHQDDDYDTTYVKAIDLQAGMVCERDEWHTFDEYNYSTALEAIAAARQHSTRPNHIYVLFESKYGGPGEWELAASAPPYNFCPHCGHSLTNKEQPNEG